MFVTASLAPVNFIRNTTPQLTYTIFDNSLDLTDFSNYRTKTTNTASSHKRLHSASSLSDTQAGSSRREEGVAFYKRAKPFDCVAVGTARYNEGAGEGCARRPERSEEEEAWKDASEAWRAVP